MIKAAYPHQRWSVYFIYCPEGQLTTAHQFTLERLSNSGARLFVVFAGLSSELVPDLVHSKADALCWKALPGFDWSAYAISLSELARNSPGSDVFVMNDSVYGPFRGLDEIWSMIKWELTGFTASSSIESYIQSYAFLLRSWDSRKLAALRNVICQDVCYNSYEDVVFCQEAQFARVAAKTMTVGPLWYADYDVCADPPIYAALSLALTGFPFIKRSLLTKHAHVHDGDVVRKVLDSYGHPSDDVL